MLRLVAFALLLQPPAREEKPSLYVVENVVEQGVIKPRNLVRLSIDREGRLVKQVILSQDGILSHFEHGAVFGPRHVVTDRGSIIDVSTGKLLSKDLGEFLGVEKGKAYFRRTGKELKRQVSSFDFFDDGKVAALADAGHWALRGAKSPNKTMTAVNQGVRIEVSRLSNQPLEIGKGYYVKVENTSSWSGGNLPCLWLDDQRILTVKSSVKLAIVTLPRGDEQLIDLPDAPEKLFSPPSLRRDAKNNVVYSCRKVYLIDVENASASLLKRYALGHGFEASADESNHEFYYMGKSIGVKDAYPPHVPTAPGRIAIHSSDGGIAVWDADLRDWRELNMHAGSIIGWSNLR